MHHLRTAVKELDQGHVIAEPFATVLLTTVLPSTFLLQGLNVPPILLKVLTVILAVSPHAGFS